MKRILVALSGGVDSAVAALILRDRGYKVAGAYIRTWIDEAPYPLGECPWKEEIESARSAAGSIGIPFRIVNLMSHYRERVVRYMIDGYRSGITPNPDVMCNREMKFGVFLDYARENGFDAVATGHYCRKRACRDGSCDLLEGADKNKDQSYFLALVRQHQLHSACFPLGELTKPEVRSIARTNRLENADRKDSQGICFLGKVEIGRFLERYIPDRPGTIVGTDGAVLGHHRGLHRFTLGQRRGIGVPSNIDHEAYVVVGKDVVGNRLMVAFDHRSSPGLYTDRIRLQHVNFVNRRLTERCRIYARPRYRDPLCPGTLTPVGKSEAIMEFDTSQRALAAGQICALYQGETLIGGGIYR